MVEHFSVKYLTFIWSAKGLKTLNDLDIDLMYIENVCFPKKCCHK